MRELNNVAVRSLLIAVPCKGQLSESPVNRSLLVVLRFLDALGDRLELLQGSQREICPAGRAYRLIPPDRITTNRAFALLRAPLLSQAGQCQEDGRFEQFVGLVLDPSDLLEVAVPFLLSLAVLAMDGLDDSLHALRHVAGAMRVQDYRQVERVSLLHQDLLLPEVQALQMGRHSTI